MVTHNMVRTYGVKSDFLKRPMLLHTCATCSELPSYVSTLIIFMFSTCSFLHCWTATVWPKKICIFSLPVILGIDTSVLSTLKAGFSFKLHWPNHVQFSIHVLVRLQYKVDLEVDLESAQLIGSCRTVLLTERARGISCLSSDYFYVNKLFLFEHLYI